MATRYSSSWRFLRTRGSRSPYVSHKPPVGRTVSHFLALLLSSSFFLRLLRACLSIIIYLHRCFFLLLLPFSSFFFFSFSLHLSSSSSSHQYTFTFPSSVACPAILVLLDSRSLTFPCFFPHSVFFFFSDSSANIPLPRSIFSLLPAFFASPATRWDRFPLRVLCVSFNRVPPVREFSRVDLTGSREWSVLKLCDKTYMGEQCRILWCVTRLYFVEETWHRYGIQQRDASGRSCFLTCLTGLFNFYPTNTLINVTVNVRRDSYLSRFSIDLAKHVSNWCFFSRINGMLLFDSCIIESEVWLLIDWFGITLAYQIFDVSIPRVIVHEESNEQKARERNRLPVVDRL